jgi:hypothetical protein
MRTKTILAASLVACLVATAFWLSYVRTLSRNHAAFAAFGEANSERLKAGASISSAEGFIAALRKIDVSSTSPRFKAAFEMYVAGMAEGVSRLKAGKDLGDSNDKVKSGYDELLAISRETGFEWLSSFDVPMATMLALSGVFVLSIRTQQQGLRQRRVDAGEITLEQSNKAGKLLNWCGPLLILCGVTIFVLSRFH